MIDSPPHATDTGFDRCWTTLPKDIVAKAIRLALDEDIGHGDITSALTLPNTVTVQGHLVARDSGVASGVMVAQQVFRMIDPEIKWQAPVSDADHVSPGDVIAVVEGDGSAVLSAERVALNFMQRMSGISTMTRSFVDAIAHTRTRIVDTRKTAPGLRLFDKYAVVCGGGFNHRFGLSDGILVKDNHIAAAGGIEAALLRVRSRAPHTLSIEIEVDRLDQIEEAVAGGADVILLDNMDPSAISEAVKLIASRTKIEASGGVSIENVAALAEAGVDYISVGKLTHSVSALDIGLDIGFV